MKTLSKAAIFEADDIKREPFPVPEWGEDSGVYLIQLSANARQHVMEVFQKHKDAGQVEQTRVVHDLLLVTCIADEKGVLLFDEKDLPQLRKRNGVVLERIVKAAMNLNGMGATAEDAAAKN